MLEALKLYIGAIKKDKVRNHDMNRQLDDTYMENLDTIITINRLYSWTIKNSKLNGKR